MQSPVNVLRVALHPRGPAPHTANLAEWRAHLLARLRRQIELTADHELIGLLAELAKYPASTDTKRTSQQRAPGVVLPLQLRTDAGVISLISTITVFGTPIDVTVAELALKCFYPADPATRDILQSVARQGEQLQASATEAQPPTSGRSFNSTGTNRKLRRFGAEPM